MSAAQQYRALLTKVAHQSSPEGIEATYSFCTKQAGFQENLLWAAVGGLPAYLVGSQMAREDEKRKHKNYALAGAAAGFLAPKLVQAVSDPASFFPSASGFDASDIKDLQLESLD